MSGKWCSGCEEKLPRSAFSGTQLKQRDDARRCAKCVRSANDARREKWCSGCKQMLPRGDFTQNQLVNAKDDARRCVNCIRNANDATEQWKWCSSCEQMLPRGAFTEEQLHHGDARRCAECIRNANEASREKWCSGCEQMLPRGDFTQHQLEHYGDARRCMSCVGNDDEGVVHKPLFCASCGRDAGREEFSRTQLELGASRRCRECVREFAQAERAAQEWKLCSKCGVELPRVDFSQHQVHNYGDARRCVRCMQSDVQESRAQSGRTRSSVTAEMVSQLHHTVPTFHAAASERMPPYMKRDALRQRSRLTVAQYHEWKHERKVASCKRFLNSADPHWEYGLPLAWRLAGFRWVAQHGAHGSGDTQRVVCEDVVCACCMIVTTRESFKTGSLLYRTVQKKRKANKGYAGLMSSLAVLVETGKFAEVLAQGLSREFLDHLEAQFEAEEGWRADAQTILSTPPGYGVAGWNCAQRWAADRHVCSACYADFVDGFVPHRSWRKIGVPVKPDPIYDSLTGDERRLLGLVSVSVSLTVLPTSYMRELRGSVVLNLRDRPVWRSLVDEWVAELDEAEAAAADWDAWCGAGNAAGGAGSDARGRGRSLGALVRATDRDTITVKLDTTVENEKADVTIVELKVRVAHVVQAARDLVRRNVHFANYDVDDFEKKVPLARPNFVCYIRTRNFLWPDEETDRSRAGSV